MGYLSTKDAAAYLGCSIHTIRKFVQHGKLAPDLRLGRGMAFATTTLDAFRAEHRTLFRPSAEQYAEAARRFHGGEALAVVAADLGIAPEHLHRKVGKRGHWISKLTDDEWAEASRRYHGGERLREVAAAFSISEDYLIRKVGARKKAG